MLEVLRCYLGLCLCTTTNCSIVVWPPTYSQSSYVDFGPVTTGTGGGTVAECSSAIAQGLTALTPWQPAARLRWSLRIAGRWPNIYPKTLGGSLKPVSVFDVTGGKDPPLEGCMWHSVKAPALELLCGGPPFGELSGGNWMIGYPVSLAPGPPVRVFGPRQWTTLPFGVSLRRLR